MKKLCPLPWLGFSNDPNGMIRPCCISKEHITKPDGSPYFIQKDSVKDILHSQYMNNLRTDLQDGKLPKNCEVCWVDEKNGYKSKREIYSDIYKDHIEEFQYKTVPEHPIDYQLILTNACNLKCRSCGTSHSTSWQKEVKSMNITDAESINQFPYTLPHKQPGDKESVFIKDIDTWASSVKRMEVVGGEPFYTEIWEKIWRYLIDKDYAKEIELAMSTNVTIFNEELIRLLDNNYKALGIGLSIDGMGETFEYLRKNAKWEDVEQNILKFYKYYKTEAKPSTTFNYTHTTSWIDSYYLPEFIEWTRKNTPEFRVWINIVHWPVHMNLTTLPDVVKNKIEAKWKNYNWLEYQDDINGLIKHMYSVRYTDEQLIAQYKKFTTLDKYRDESTIELIQENFPEMIKYFK